GSSLRSYLVRSSTGDGGAGCARVLAAEAPRRRKSMTRGRSSGKICLFVAMIANPNTAGLAFWWVRHDESPRMAAMTESARSRGFIALFAAYAVALQALLLPLTVAAGAQNSGLCLSAASAGHPTGDQSGCPCAAGCGLQCCTQSSVPPSPI